MDINNQPIILEPIMLKGEILLYDIYVGTDWYGSRRTVEACRTFLGISKEDWDKDSFSYTEER